ncbi:glycosyltransferase family 2 protein [Aporhodopirellula aestuarii]|uniref:Glycosyltransferase n=1 Tax=Aporhodopirellula aestuarii TaxID=2950107 RepID=A0ABT0U942_9BACT|nr:glycosyltransferase [Aporhodopirellula aestuarii]MCM2373296.1 glycosyltransferase [Aporhodopirellula aestuarii]
MKQKSGWPWEGEDQAFHQRSGVKYPQAIKSDQLPRITVITPNFNQGEFLEETIRSVLMQDYPNLEYIVVDGGSTDASGEVLDHYARCITHVIQEKDTGQSNAICKGLRFATGDIFNWIHSDCRLEPGTLCELAANFRDSADLYAFEVCVEDTQGNPPIDSDHRIVNRNLSAAAMLRCDPYSFCQPGLWFRMESLYACGGIDRSLNEGFDWDLVIRYLSQFPRVQYSRSTGAMFRLHDQCKTIEETPISDSTENRVEQENDRIRAKLERKLSPRLAAASRLGRRREPWNQHVAAVLDDFNCSPVTSALGLMREAVNDPRARFSLRTGAAIVRLLSRYARNTPKPNVSS